MLNSLDAGRRLALRTMLLQLAVAAVVGAMFLLKGHREAVSAAAAVIPWATAAAMYSKCGVSPRIRQPRQTIA